MTEVAMAEVGADDYYQRRAAQELELARQAETPAVRGIHRELASLYRERATRIGHGDDPSHLHITLRDADLFLRR